MLNSDIALRKNKGSCVRSTNGWLPSNALARPLKRRMVVSAKHLFFMRSDTSSATAIKFSAQYSPVSDEALAQYQANNVTYLRGVAPATLLETSNKIIEP